MSHIVLDGQMVTGGLIITVAAVFAMVSLLLTLFHILLSLVIPAYARRMSSPQERSFIMSPLGFYIICLFASNFISSIGGLIEAYWVGANAITQGPICTTQAFALQLGGNASALWTAVISISALRTFVFRARSLSKLVTLPLIFVLWITMIVFDGLASTIFADHSGSFFYGIASMWCWITPTHRTARLAIQYIWMWACALISAVCFLLVFLSVRGNVTVKRNGHRRSVRWSRRTFSSYVLGNGEEYYAQLVGTVGKTLCWFPISYITLTLPISIARVAETYGFPVPVYAFILSAVCFLLLGIAFPILYLAIRHTLKHSSSHISSDSTLRGSLGEKLGSESFQTPQEKRPSPVSKSALYPWTPMPTTREWVPPLPHHGINETTSRPSSTVSYATTRGGDDRRSAYYDSHTAQKQIPDSLKLGQRRPPLHHAMGSISTIKSSGMTGLVTQLSPVSGRESPSGSIVQPQLALPPAALVAHRQSLPVPRAICPSDSLSPSVQSGHKRSGTDVSVYTGPRAISPDLNALLEASQKAMSPTGPPPPPRKARRVPISSVPVDVDESDQGSICSARPSIETFDPEETRPMSIGDITARNGPRRVDSVRAVWAAYGGSSMTPETLPPGDARSLKRDTMRTFWAAYEDPSPSAFNLPAPSDAAALNYRTTLDYNITSPESLGFRTPDPSVSLKPSISAVGRAPRRRNTPSPSISNAVAGHQPSRSITQMPQPPVAALRPGSLKLRSSRSANALVNNSKERRTPTPTSSETTSGTDGSYRIPRSQPGYV